MKPEDFTNQSLEQLRDGQQKLKDRFQPTPTEVPAEYAAKLRGEQQPDTIEAMIRRARFATLRPQKQITHAMPYDDARRLTWVILGANVSHNHRRFMVDDFNRQVIVNLIRYFIGDPACEWDLQKGILLFGGIGGGKTLLMRAMQTLCRTARLSEREFAFAVCADLVDEVKAEGSTEGLRRWMKGDCCFDDLGQEPLIVKVYGNDMTVMERILTKRYEAFVNGKCITHATSNLTPEELDTMYGSRVGDRMREMFNFVFLDGQSRRK